MAGMGKYVKKPDASGAAAPARAAVKVTLARDGKERATFHVPRGLLAEVRDAVVHLSGPPERMTLARFAEDALTRELERMRTKHNHGKPFPKSVAPLKGGRPIGS